MDNSEEQKVAIENVQSRTKPEKQKWSVKKKIAVIAGAIVLFVVAIIAMANMATSGATKVGDELVAGIQNNKPTIVYDLMSDTAKQVVSIDDITTVLNQISPILTGEPELKSREVNSSTNNGTTGVVVYNIKGNDNVEYILTVNLTKSDDVWKVLNFETTAE